MKYSAIRTFVTVAVAVNFMLVQQIFGAGTKTESFQTFWSSFREAVLADNGSAVASMTNFPFLTRGELDGDPVKSYSRADFEDLLGKLLDSDPGLSPEPDTMRNLIRKTKTIKTIGKSGDSARAGNFLFRKINGNWRLTMSYLNED